MKTVTPSEFREMLARLDVKVCPQPTKRRFATLEAANARLATIEAFPATEVHPTRAYACDDHFHLTHSPERKFP